MSAELKKQVCDAIDAMRSELANPSGYSGTRDAWSDMSHFGLPSGLP